jgi:hypothetical protein
MMRPGIRRTLGTLALTAFGLAGIGCSALPGTQNSQSGLPSTASATPTMIRRAPAPSPATKVKVARPAPGKKGFVLSPFAREPKLIDVRNVPTGTRVQDPYSGRYFEVP